MRNIRIKIANIVFNINTDYEFDLSEIDRTYHPFLTGAKPKITINFVYHEKFPLSILAKSSLVFDSQAYWRLYHYKDKIVIVWMTPGKNSHITHIGIFKENFKSGIIHTRYRYRYLSKSPRYRNKVRISKKPLELFYQNLLGVIMLNLPAKDMVMFHAAGIKDEKNGYLFPGYSGDGKSTMSNFWRGNGTIILSDEYIVVKRNNCKFSMYGTPWCGSNSQDYSPEKVLLKKIYILNKARVNQETGIDKSLAVSYLLARCKLPVWSKEETDRKIKLCSDMVNKKFCYKLDFLPDQSIVEYIRKNN